MRSSFTIPGDPVGKPRMTRSDQWRQRDCVVKYRDWADAARTVATGIGDPEHGKITDDVLGVHVYAHFAVPESWSKKKKAAAYGRLDRSSSDADNILKAVMDALFAQDKTIAITQALKFWCEEGQEPHTDIFLLSLPPDEASCVAEEKKES